MEGVSVLPWLLLDQKTRPKPWRGMRDLLHVLLLEEAFPAAVDHHQPAPRPNL